jgi:hypothetical protein
MFFGMVYLWQDDNWQLAMPLTDKAVCRTKPKIALKFHCEIVFRMVCRAVVDPSDRAAIARNGNFMSNDRRHRPAAPPQNEAIAK